MSRASIRGAPVRGRGDSPLYAALRVFCAFVIVPIYRYRARGGAHLPDSGGVILAMSHKSWWDPVFAAMAFDRPLRFMAKSELFRSPISRAVVTTLGAFPIRRGEGDVEALRRSLEILRRGEVLAMFPEGTRHHDDVIHPFHAGIALLAARSGAPVVPVALRGTKRMTSHKLPRFPHVRVAVGEPVDLGGIAGKGSERHAVAAETVRRRVQELYDEL